MSTYHAPESTNTGVYALNPSFAAISNINVYVSKKRLYLVGSTQDHSKFRLLQIVRGNVDVLEIIDDDVEYSARQIEEVLSMIAATAESKSPMVKKSAFGILGFIRFLQGWYIILITERRCMAMIGSHLIYKVEDVVMFPVADAATFGPPMAEEEKYVTSFLNVDVTSNFYFSYTYDLTRPLQNNMHIPTPAQASGEEVTEPVIPNCDIKYVWNSYLTESFRQQVVSKQWVLSVMHGFVGQSHVDVYGNRLYVTLIARRSRNYAGPRFLKRGCNDQGDVANDVETEQIVHCASTLNHSSGKYTSYVQLRGSVPCFWSQDHLGFKAKPPIRIDRPDPYASQAAIHFDQLFSKYGTPVVINNLVKRKEKKPRESILNQALTDAVLYLNAQLPEDKTIRYFAWDMARCAHSKDGNVLATLNEIAERTMRLTGFFHAGPQPYGRILRPGIDPSEVGGRGYSNDEIGRLQTGVVRSNCVDCIDRTNTAQFSLGICAFRHQLYALGVLDTPHHLKTESATYQLMEELYEDLGDIVALQYGGSQLVNRVQTYRRTSPWHSHSRDIRNTMARYLANNFKDSDKQQATNVFLGIARPQNGIPHFWLTENDFHLHFPSFYQDDEIPHPPYINWHKTDLNEAHRLAIFPRLISSKPSIINFIDHRTSFDSEVMTVPALQDFLPFDANNPESSDPQDRLNEGQAPSLSKAASMQSFVVVSQSSQTPQAQLSQVASRMSFLHPTQSAIPDTKSIGRSPLSKPLPSIVSFPIASDINMNISQANLTHQGYLSKHVNEIVLPDQTTVAWNPFEGAQTLIANEFGQHLKHFLECPETSLVTWVSSLRYLLGKNCNQGLVTDFLRWHYKAIRQFVARSTNIALNDFDREVRTIVVQIWQMTAPTPEDFIKASMLFAQSLGYTFKPSFQAQARTSVSKSLSSAKVRLSFTTPPSRKWILNEFYHPRALTWFDEHFELTMPTAVLNAPAHATTWSPFEIVPPKPEGDGEDGDSDDGDESDQILDIREKRIGFRVPTSYVSFSLKPRQRARPRVQPTHETGLQEPACTPDYARFCDVPNLKKRLLHEVLLGPVDQCIEQLDAISRDVVRPIEAVASVAKSLHEEQVVPGSSRHYSISYPIESTPNLQQNYVSQLTAMIAFQVPEVTDTDYQVYQHMGQMALGQVSYAVPDTKRYSQYVQFGLDNVW